MLTPLEESDLEFLRGLRNACREWFFDGREVPAESQREWFARVQGDGAVRFFVLWDGGQRVGAFSLTDRGGRVEVGNVMLVPDARDRGLMGQAIAGALCRDAEYFARIKPENGESLRLFRRLGFVVGMKDASWVEVRRGRIDA